MGEDQKKKSSLELAHRLLRGLGYEVNKHMAAASTFSSEKVEHSEALQTSPPPRTRKESLSRMKTMDIITDFTDVQYCRLALLYQEHAQGDLAVTQVKSNMQKIHRFVAYAQNPNRSEFEVLRNLQKATDFVNILKKCMQPNSIRNHCAAMVDLTDVLTASRAARMQLPGMFRKRLKSTRRHWFNLKKKFEKLARKQQRTKMVSSQFREAPVALMACYLNEFWSSGQQKIMVEAIRQKSCNNDQMKIILCVMACVLALHGQRNISVINMTNEEVQSASYFNGRYIVRIARNKTYAAFGPSAVALKKHQYELFKQVCDARDMKPSDIVMSDLKGGMTKNFFKPLQIYLLEREDEKWSLNFNLFRSTIETNRKKCAVMKAGTKTCSYLNHSPDVAGKHYEYKTDAVVVSEYIEVETILFQITLLWCLKKRQILSSNILPLYCLGMNFLFMGTI